MFSDTSPAYDLLKVYFFIINSNRLSAENTDYQGFLNAVKSATQERMDLAPKAGTDIHKVLEDFLNYRAPEGIIEQKICLSVNDVLKKHCDFDYQNHNFETEKYLLKM